MKKLLNPKLNFTQEAVVIDSSSSEEAKIVKQGTKSKEKLMAKPSSSSSQPTETKRSQLVREIKQPRSEMLEIIAEIKDRLIEQQEGEKVRACNFENQEWDEEDISILKQAGIIEESIVHVYLSDLLMQDENVMEKPSFDDENLQERVQKYKQLVKQLQDNNDSLFKVNKGLIEELQDVHHHFLQLSEVSKEVLKRKAATDRYSKELERTIESLQQENEDLQKKVADLERKHKRAKKRS